MAEQLPTSLPDALYEAGVSWQGERDANAVRILEQMPEVAERVAEWIASAYLAGELTEAATRGR